MSISSSSMSCATSRQLHTLLPGPTGGHACLTLYDDCPHNRHSARPLLRNPYLHCDLPSLSTPGYTQAIEYVNEDKTVFETSYTTLSRLREESPATKLAPLVFSKHSPLAQHIRDSTNPPRSMIKLQKPTSDFDPPTIYIITFSTDRTPTTRAFAELLNVHLPPRIPLLYTIDARSVLVPPSQICAAYSGVTEVVQSAVLQDPRARREIRDAVDDLVKFVQGEKSGGKEVSLAVCCTAGTHRSVAIAELIGLGVRKEVRRLRSRGGVKVVVRHVHRIKGVRDAY